MSERLDMAASQVIDSTGRVIKGDVTIELMPGIGVSGPTGDHLDRENGPHTVPIAFAGPLITSGRARVVEKPAAEPAPDAQVQGAPSGVQQRDPVPTSREGRRR